MLILPEPSFPHLLIGHNYSIYYTGLLWAFIQMRKYKWKFVASIDALGQYHCYSGDYCLPHRYLNLRTVATNVVEYFLSWLLRNGFICIHSLLGRRTTWPLSLLGRAWRGKVPPLQLWGECVLELLQMVWTERQMGQDQSTCWENEESCALGRKLEICVFASQSPYLSCIRMTLMHLSMAW